MYLTTEEDEKAKLGHYALGTQGRFLIESGNGNLVKLKLVQLMPNVGEDRDSQAEVHIKCEEAKAWNLQTSDVVKLSLKDEQFSEKGEKGGPHRSIKLVYDDCAVLQIVERRSNPSVSGVIFDAWKGPCL